ncbi:hypothetical protein IT575_01990 [bacterium]|nr:hypothetical protein [bacterium]
MKALNLYLWISALVLSLGLASCGGTDAGSPIQAGLDAQQQEAAGDAPDTAALQDAPRDSSYLPGGYAYCYGPYSMVNHHYNYNYYWGNVKEAPDGLGDKLSIRGGKSTPSGVRYWFTKGQGQAANARIRRLYFQGFGTQLQVHLLNVSTGNYDPWQTLNMNDAAAHNHWPSLRVDPQHVNSAGRVVAEVRSPAGQVNDLYVIMSDVW